MSNAWHHLPNAAHIDRILASENAHTGVWAVHSALGCATREVAYTAAMDAAWTMSKQHGALSASWYAARSAMTGAARGAIMALAAYDNSSQYLDMTGDELEVWVALSGGPECVLLLPALRAFENIAALVDS